ncbi:hypothetical protein D3C72_968450 [compost metagenome]
MKDVLVIGLKMLMIGTYLVLDIGVFRCQFGEQKIKQKKLLSVLLKNCTMQSKNRSKQVSKKKIRLKGLKSEIWLSQIMI